MSFLADLVVVLHLAFIAFVILGGLVALRRPRWAWFHLPCAVWGGLIELTGWYCPLTPLEVSLRRAAGGAGYEGSFIGRYLLPLIYPAGLTREVQLVLAGVVVGINAVVYGFVIRRRYAGPWLTATFALVAFAANSILCRLALGAGAIDAAPFTLLRLACGALCLLAITTLARRRAHGKPRRDLFAATMLFGYALAFSFAYRDLSAGTGALILFAMVQATMIGWGLHRGERLAALGWMGLLLAVAGLVVLVSPGLRAPTPRGAVLMALAGIAWGAYSLRGRGATDPLSATTGNFALAVVPALAVFTLPQAGRHITMQGALWAAASGALASALGYVAWYAALRRLSVTGAATIQLLVPVIAAVGGVILLGEPPSARLAAAAAMTLGGVRLVLARRGRRLCTRSQS